MARGSRPALGGLFLLIAVGFAGIAVAAALAGGGAWVIAVASGLLAAVDGRAWRCGPSGRRLYALTDGKRRTRDPGPLARVQADGRPGAPRPADPHVRAAREVRRRPARQRAPGARRGGRPRLVRAARPDRRDRAVRPGARHQVRDVRDRADQGLDHRRAALHGLGAALGAGAGARHRAVDRGARGEAPPRAERRGDLRRARDHRGGVPGFAARDLPLLDRGARRAVGGRRRRRPGRADRHARGSGGARSRRRR